MKRNEGSIGTLCAVNGPAPAERSRGSIPAARRRSARSRIVGVALAGALLAGLMGITGVVTVVRGSASASQAARLGRAAAANEASIDHLRRVERGLTGADTLTEAALRTEIARAGSSAVEVERQTQDAVDEATRLQAAQATQRYLDVASASPPGSSRDRRTEGFADAVAARRQLGRALDDAASQAQAGVDDDRSTALVVVIVLLVAGTAALLALGFTVAGSIIEPLRRLGRSMRRFGDGVLDERADTAPDEVGVLARSFNHLAERLGGEVRRLSTDAQWGTQLRIIAEALDLATEEADVYRIVEHAMSMLAPSVPMEMLLDDATSGELHQVAVSPSGGPPNCPVETSAGCIAIRRGQTAVFPSSSEINACPLLRDRPGGPCSAVCVPIAHGGSLLGVLHVTGPDGAPPEAGLIEQLAVLAGQAGARIGALRTLASTRLEAATDTLTGLANRRSLESQVRDLLRVGTTFVLAVADLDHFKSLNDSYGHEMGDRALVLFSNVLLDNVRDHDVVARLGGEEFVLVFPQTPVSPAIDAIERIRNALARAVAASSFPVFTCSFGLTHSSVADDVEGVIRIADAGLLMAKEMGRDRVVVADAEMAAEVFARHPDPRS